MANPGVPDAYGGHAASPNRDTSESVPASRMNDAQTTASRDQIGTVPPDVDASEETKVVSK